MNCLSRIIVLSLFACLTCAGVARGTGGPPQKNYTGMFDLYQDNRAQGIGNYVTVDFILTAASLLQEEVAAGTEQQELLPVLETLVSTLQGRLQELPADRRGQSLALAYLSVLRGLLDPRAVPPAAVAETVKRELALVAGHAGIARSALTGQQEDYTQYVVRGRYTRNEQLGRYFLASLYAGRTGFALKESAATGVTATMADEQAAAALLISSALAADDALSRGYERLNRTLTLLAGGSDDLTPMELLKFAGERGDGGAGITGERNRIVAGAKAAQRLPRIIGGVVDTARLEQGVSVAEATLSFRLLGQRYTPDSDALQRLVYDRVTDYRGKGTPFTAASINGRIVRGFPTVLDILSALGSLQARQILNDAGDASYVTYDQELARAAVLLGRAVQTPRSLNELNLRLASRLIGHGTPDSLNAAAGVWIMNRHALILMAKQSYTARTKSIRVEPPAPERTEARLETAPDIYHGLIENLYTVDSVLTIPELRQRVEQFTSLLMELVEIGYRQEEGKATARDRSILNNLDTTLKGIIGGSDFPLVADIHTEPTSGQVVEEGIGHPRPVTRENLRGGRLSCHEFKQPQNQRLTDEAWARLLASPERPRSLTDLIMPTK